jgi:hypothetical protein
MPFVRSILGLLLPAALLSCAGPAAPPVRIRLEGPGDLPLLVLEAPGPGVGAVVSPSSAGRIVHYTQGGSDLLWQPPGGRGGGYGLDVGPEPRTVPVPHPEVDRQAYEWAKLGDLGITVTSAPCPSLGLRIHRQVTLEAATGALLVVARMKNISAREQSWCFWDRTLARGGGFTLIPLNPKSRFKAKWVLGRRSALRPWDYDGDRPAHENCRVLDGVLVVRSRGPEQKVGADSDQGWIGYVLGDLLFVKYYAYDPRGNYTDGGLTVAHYYNQNFAELEPIGPEVGLPPGGESIFPERWTLRRLDRPVETFEEARQAAASIPPSPLPH